MKVLYFILLFSSLGLSQTAQYAECQPLSKDTEKRVESYLTSRLVSGSATKVAVTSEQILAGSCYHRLTLTMTGAKGEFVMYLSPDQRFLTSTVYDLSINSQEELARIAENVTQLFMRDRSPRFADSGPVTLVEFVDFQCPYCKRFANWYSELPDALRSQTTLVFKHLPLPQHQWARRAALYATCANFQSPLAFRQIHSFFFENQTELTTNNLSDRLVTALRSSGINLEKLEGCASGEDAARIVERDISIAAQLNVTSTPTLFIDGRRVLQVRSADELRRLLEDVASANISRGQTSVVKDEQPSLSKDHSYH